MMSRNACTLRREVSISRSATEAIGSRSERSMVIASRRPTSLIDTSRLSVHALRDIIHKRVEQRSAGRLSISFESFGFKRGIPGDADFVFDARALPHPYWEPGLRNLTGRDADVIRFLETHTNVA